MIPQVKDIRDELEKTKVRLVQVEKDDEIPKNWTDHQSHHRPMFGITASTNLIRHDGHVQDVEPGNATQRKLHASVGNLDSDIMNMPSVDPVQQSHTHILTVEELRIEILHTQSLLNFLQDQFGPVKEKLAALTMKSEVTYDLLWLLFPRGSEVSFKETHSGLLCAGKVSVFSWLVFYDRLWLRSIRPSDKNKGSLALFSTLIIMAIHFTTGER